MISEPIAPKRPDFVSNRLSLAPSGISLYSLIFSGVNLFQGAKALRHLSVLKARHLILNASFENRSLHLY